jgi:hypothetical protein
MELIKRQISLENSTNRANFSSSWGTMTASTFYIDVFLTQNVDDMGLFTDIKYFPNVPVAQSPVDYTILRSKMIQSGYTSPFIFGILPPAFTGITQTDIQTLRFTGNTESSYYAYFNLPITGLTDSKVEDVYSYSQLDRLKVGLDIEAETYINYIGNTINGVSRVSSDGDPVVYVVDTANNNLLGTNNQTSGILYRDFSGLTRTITYEDGESQVIPVTEFRFIGEGINQTNVSLSALTKEEYLFGIISTPEIKNDVFIDRGVTSVMDMHLRLSEIKNMGELTRYGNGFYTIRRT